MQTKACDRLLQGVAFPVCSSQLLRSNLEESLREILLLLQAGHQLYLGRRIKTYHLKRLRLKVVKVLLLVLSWKRFPSVSF